MIVRIAEMSDAAAMVAPLNEIIRIGATTAHEDGASARDITEWHRKGSDAIGAPVAEEDDFMIELQWFGWDEGVPDGRGDIGTFAVAAAQAQGVTAINAAIRAANTPGLGWDSRRGFQDCQCDPSFTLKHGPVAGRVFKRFGREPSAV